MKNKILITTLALLLLAGCGGHILRKEVVEQASKVGFVQASANIENSIGSVFIWGGFIVKNRSMQDGTYIEVVESPLHEYGGFANTDVSRGRFLIYSPTHLDSSIYSSGRLVTVAGKLIGSKTAKIDEREYKYPLLEAVQIHLWNRIVPPPPFLRPYFGPPYFYPPYPYPWPPVDRWPPGHNPPGPTPLPTPAPGPPPVRN